MKDLLKNNIYLIVAGCCASILLTSCGWFGEEEGQSEEPLAEVYDQKLYPSEVEMLLQGEDLADSMAMVKSIVDHWVDEQLMLNKAKENLPEELLDVESLVEDYRASLIIYNYQNEIIRQRIGGEIPEEELRSYYHEYIDNYTLDEDVFRLKFIQLPLEATATDTLYDWMKEGDQETKSKLLSFSEQRANAYDLGDSTWHNRSHVLNQFPMKEYQLDGLAVWKKQDLFKDENYAYIVRVEEYIKKGKSAPFPLVKEDILAILMNKKKQELMDEIYLSTREEAVASGNIKVNL